MRPTVPAMRPPGRRWEEGPRQATREAGSGGSVPLLQTRQQAAPNAEFLPWAPKQLAAAPIHASDERMNPSRIQPMILAQALLLEVSPTEEAPGS